MSCRLSLPVILTCAAAVVSGCSETPANDTSRAPAEASPVPSPSVESDVAGTYELIKVGDKAPPATVIEEGGTRMEVVSGTIELTDAGRIIGELTVNASGSDGRRVTLTEPLRGEWSRVGQQVSLDWDDGCDDDAVFQGNRLGFLECDTGVMLGWERR